MQKNNNNNNNNNKNNNNSNNKKDQLHKQISELKYKLSKYI